MILTKPSIPILQELDPAGSSSTVLPAAATFPIVGIGASAGGLEAFKQLLSQLPADSGMGFVLVSHLDPQHESLLTQLLAQVTAMPVTTVSARVRVEANHIYVIPPNMTMTIAGGVLSLTPRSPVRELHLPIDRFFSALAHDRGSQSVGVILSGTGSDGAHGVQVIRAAGGLTFAQDEATAEYPEMPHSAIASGAVDFVLPLAEIAPHLAKISRHALWSQAEEQAEAVAEAAPETATEEPTGEAGETAAGTAAELKAETAGLPVQVADDVDMQAVFGLLRTTSGVDFPHYKRNTLARRILRRMLLNDLERLDQYVAFLKVNPTELEHLVEDLLIKVTCFFRVPEKFEALKAQIFPALLERATAGVPIRIWVPACSTGEEAYSIAIALSELVEDKRPDITVQIFATDVSEGVIAQARAGVYPGTIANWISPERLRRYFVRQGDGYRIGKSIRETCTFAVHNVLADPPLSKMDLVSCCNLLIYLKPIMQRKLLASLHYALQPAGFLSLSDSESILPSGPPFTVLDARHKLYAKLPSRPQAQVEMSASQPQPLMHGGVRTDPPWRAAGIVDATSLSADVDREADRLLLTRYAPAGVVVNDKLEILVFRGSTGAYLEHPSGSASLNLSRLVRAELFLELRTAIQQVRTSGGAVRKEGLQVNRDGKVQDYNLEIVPLKSAAPELNYLVLFEEVAGAGALRADKPVARKPKSGALAVQNMSLRRELAATALQLRAMESEHDVAEAGLRSEHGDVLSNNVELQSLNEELEASKEELQASNQELITMNEELRSQSEQIVAAREFADSIVATVREPLVVLDAKLVVRSANRAFYRKFQTTPDVTEGYLIHALGNCQWDLPELRRRLTQLLSKNEEIVDFEVVCDLPVVGRKIMLLNASPIVSEAVILLGFDDVTEVREAMLVKDHAMQLREQFLSVASHELRTPVTVIQGYIQGLLNMVKREIEAVTQENGGHAPATISVDRVRLLARLEGAEAATRRLGELMTRLLNLKYLLQTAVPTLAPDPVDLAVLVAGVIDAELAKSEAAAFGPRVAVRFAQPADSYWGYWDAGQLQQVLANMLDNAIKYSLPGSEVGVQLTYSEAKVRSFHGTVAHILVHDQGIGIPADFLERIFEPFVRAPNALSAPSGGGLGLAICNEIIERHGGRVWADSPGPGQGSTFHVLLPVVTVART